MSAKTAYISDEAEAAILDAIEPRDFFELMQWRMRRQGTSYRGACPLHGGDNKQAFAYSLRHRRFFCATHCGSLGNFIQVYAKAKGISRTKAAKELAQWKGISLKGKMVYRRAEEAIREKRVVTEHRASVASLPLVETWETDPLEPLREHPRFSAAAIARFRIQVAHAGRYRNRIVFPIHDINARWVGNNGRWMGEDYDAHGVPKYLYSPLPFETRHILYGAHLALNSPYWILHEGVTDVIKAWEHGYETVSVLGSALTEEQAEIIRTYPKPVVLGFDGDAAGQKAARQAITLLFQKHITDISVMIFPSGKDPGALTKDEYELAFSHRLPAVLYMSRHGNPPA